MIRLVTLKGSPSFETLHVNFPLSEVEEENITLQFISIFVQAFCLIFAYFSL